MSLTTIIIVVASLSLSAECRVMKVNPFPSINPDFENSVKARFFVDKSLCAKTFLEDEDTIAYVSAPGYFGKSLTLQMLKHFLEIPVLNNGIKLKSVTDSTNYKLFSGTKVFEEAKTFFDKHFGMFPVVFIDYRRLRNVYCFPDMVQKMKQIMWRTFYHHKYLMRVNSFWNNEFNKTLFMGYVNKKRSNKLTVSDLENGLDFLCRILHAYFEVKPVVLIDEYEAFVHGLLFKDNVRDTENMTQLMNTITRPVFNTSDPIVTRVFCSGILHTTGDGMIPKDRPLAGYQFLQNHRYSHCYGLSEDEVARLVSNYTNNPNEVKTLDTYIRKYYGGYKIRNGPKVYSVLQVLSYLKNHTIGPNYIATYFASKQFMKQFMHLFYYKPVKDNLLGLLRHGLVRFQLFDSLSANDVTALMKLIKGETGLSGDYVVNLAFNYLLQCGYLSFENDNDSGGYHNLRLANLEVKLELKNLLKNSILAYYRLRKLYVTYVLKSIDSFSTANHSETDFKAIYTKFFMLMVDSKYAPLSGEDFQNDLYTIFASYFEPIAVPAGLESETRAAIVFRNHNNVSFILETEFLNNKTDVKEEQVAECARAAVDRIRQNGMIRALDEERRSAVVYMGVCLSVNGAGKLFGLAYSKCLDAGDNLNSTTVYSKPEQTNEFDTTGLV